jgi:hypothetical protein
MTGIRVDHARLDAASAQLGEVASRLDGLSTAHALAGLAGALPGSACCLVLERVGAEISCAIRVARSELDAAAAALAASAAGYRAADHLAAPVRAGDHLAAPVRAGGRRGEA